MGRDLIYCNLCDIYSKDMKNHINSRKHTYIKKELFEKRKDQIHCDKCNTYVKNLKQHLKSKKHMNQVNNESQIKESNDYIHCKLCNVYIKRFKEHSKSKKHIKIRDELLRIRKASIYCQVCNSHSKNFNQHLKSNKHRKRKKVVEFHNKYKCNYNESQSAVNGLFKEYKYNNIDTSNYKEYLEIIKNHVRDQLTKQKNDSLKYQMDILVEFYKDTAGGIETIESWFNSGIFRPTSKINFDEQVYSELTNTISKKIEQFTCQSSGWTINKLKAFELKIVKYDPIKASSYIELPGKFTNSKFKLVNIKNTDNECFKWAVARFFCADEKHSERISKKLKKEAEKFNFEGIEFPMKLNKIYIFEKNNQISINVFSFNDKLELYPLRITQQNFEPSINLLLITNEENSHYVLMKSLSPFSKPHRKIEVCPYCLQTFYKKEKLDEHKIICSTHEPVKVEFTDKEKLEFSNYDKTIKHPFVIYADFESTLERIQTCEPNIKGPFYKPIQKHTANSFCVYTKCKEDQYSKLETYIGPNSAEKFIEYLKSEVHRIYKLLKINKPIYLPQEKYKLYKEATVCYICHKAFTEENYKVRDHNHLTGVFNGAAHNKCNLKIRNPNYIPVFIHNLSNYDSHLFIKELGKYPGKLNIIPENSEKCISLSQKFTVDQYWNKRREKECDISRELRFLDSFRFLPSSLNTLASNLMKDNMKNLKKYFHDEDKFKAVCKKGIYPYDWFDNDRKFNAEKLPSKEEFYSRLNNENVSDENYEHAKKVWNLFKCKNFRDYHEIYLKVDTLLLADVFENFREASLNTYGVDPAHYFTTPGLAFDSLLKYSNAKIDYIKDSEILLFVEKGIRGGISTITKRYAKANNEEVIDYDKRKKKSYITYLDANNLYGYAMSQYLPTGNFKWVENIDFMSLSDESEKGYILEVDLEYPKELHDEHNDLPLAAESIKVSNVHKLIPNLMNKTKYVIHYRNLKQCIKYGLKLNKIHRILEFDQSPWMKSYIDLNTFKRKEAIDDFSKDFYKLMNNSVFGKTMENIRNRVDIKLVKNEKELKKLANKPNLVTITRYSDNLIACHMQKAQIIFDKPIYVGMCILDLSKTLIYKFHYDTIKKKYRDRAELLFTDTDSLCYEIQTSNLTADRKEDIDKYDTSNYPENHDLYSCRYKKQIGKMKDETAGNAIIEFVGLRAKLYCFKTNEYETKKAKGVKKKVIEKDIKMDEYKKVLFKKEEIYKKMTNIQSKNHELYTTEINKIALSSQDDKRYILEDNIHTLALGHYRMKMK